MNASLDRKAMEFLSMHNQQGKALVIPNAWDITTARIFEDAGFPAVATSSAAMFVSQGYTDGEDIGRSKLLEVLGKMSKF